MEIILYEPCRDLEIGKNQSSAERCWLNIDGDGDEGEEGKEEEEEESV